MFKWFYNFFRSDPVGRADPFAGHLSGAHYGGWLLEDALEDIHQRLRALEPPHE